jgi:hypothetical protein
MKFLDSFFSSLHPSDAVASAVRDYFDWQIQHHSEDFISGADGKGTADIPVLSGAKCATKLRSRTPTALKKFYHWAQTEGVISRSL